MATANKEDILLRDTINPPLVTKGSELTYNELDGNMITIFNQLVALSQSSNVAAYSAIIEYVTNRYVMSDNQLWKMINALPQTNVTPGTNPTVWEKVFASDLVQEPTGLIEFTTIISSANVLNMNTSPQKLMLNPGSGKAIELMNGSLTVDFDETSPGGTPYDTNITIYIGPETMDFASGDRLFEVADVLSAQIKQTLPLKVNTIGYSSSKNYITENEALVAAVKSGDPLNGDSDIIIRGVYRVIDVS